MSKTKLLPHPLCLEHLHGVTDLSQQKAAESLENLRGTLPGVGTSPISLGIEDLGRQEHHRAWTSPAHAQQGNQQHTEESVFALGTFRKWITVYSCLDLHIKHQALYTGDSCWKTR